MRRARAGRRAACVRRSWPRGETMVGRATRSRPFFEQEPCPRGGDSGCIHANGDRHRQASSAPARGGLVGIPVEPASVPRSGKERAGWKTFTRSSSGSTGRGRRSARSARSDRRPRCDRASAGGAARSDEPARLFDGRRLDAEHERELGDMEHRRHDPARPERGNDRAARRLPAGTCVRGAGGLDRFERHPMLAEDPAGRGAGGSVTLPEQDNVAHRVDSGTC